MMIKHGMRAVLSLGFLAAFSVSAAYAETAAAVPAPLPADKRFEGSFGPGPVDKAAWTPGCKPFDIGFTAEQVFEAQGNKAKMAAYTKLYDNAETRYMDYKKCVRDNAQEDLNAFGDSLSALLKVKRDDLVLTVKPQIDSLVEAFLARAKKGFPKTKAPKKKKGEATAAPAAVAAAPATAAPAAPAAEARIIGTLTGGKASAPGYQSGCGEFDVGMTEAEILTAPNEAAFEALRLQAEAIKPRLDAYTTCLADNADKDIDAMRDRINAAMREDFKVVGEKLDRQRKYASLYINAARAKK